MRTWSRKRGLERRSRVYAALLVAGSVNGAAQIFECSWHTVNSDLRVLANWPTRFERDPMFRAWVGRERKKIEVLRLREAGCSFREIAKRTGIPLATCHRWWHREMGS